MLKKACQGLSMCVFAECRHNVLVCLDQVRLFCSQLQHSRDYFAVDCNIVGNVLHYKDKNEVDFLVIKNQQPWMLVEVKNSNNHRISQHLKKFHQQLQTKHTFQVIIDLPYESVDCFNYSEPVIVPAITWLSQLV